MYINFCVAISASEQLRVVLNTTVYPVNLVCSKLCTEWLLNSVYVSLKPKVLSENCPYWL